MAGSGNQLKALLRSHAHGDDAAFYATASQIAASAARQGHAALAAELKGAISEARDTSGPRLIAMPRADDALSEVATESHPTARLQDLVLPEALLERIAEVVTEQRQRSALIERGYNPIHRLLLEGPPGTGKTLTASVLATELEVPLYTVRLDALLTRFLGETSSKLRVVFNAMEERRGVYLFDEFDALGADRSGSDVGEARRILNSFLVMIEETSPHSVVIASTNHRRSLDRALFRRFDASLIYELPDADERTAVLRRRLARAAPARAAWKPLAQESDGLSHAELVAAAEQAAKRAILRGDERTTQQDLLTAIAARQATARG